METGNLGVTGQLDDPVDGGSGATEAHQTDLSGTGAEDDPFAAGAAVVLQEDDDTGDAI